MHNNGKLFFQLTIQKQHNNGLWNWKKNVIQWNSGQIKQHNISILSFSLFKINKSNHITNNKSKSFQWSSESGFGGEIKSPFLRWLRVRSRRKALWSTMKALDVNWNNHFFRENGRRMKEKNWRRETYKKLRERERD